MIENKFDVILLAAGESKRMGVSKLRLEFTSHISFAQQIINQYIEHDELNCIYWVVNSKDLEFAQDFKKKYNKIKIIENKYPQKERFYSIFLAIDKMPILYNCFIQNIDNPFITFHDINKIINHTNKGDYLVPQVENKTIHPILISKKIVEKIKFHTNFDTTLKKFLQLYKRETIEIQNINLLFNINTPLEYENIFLRKVKTL